MTNQSVKNNGGQSKFIEPTFNFNSKRIKIGEDYTTQKIAVNDLVKPGHIIAHFPDFAKYASKGFSPVTVEAGEFTQHVAENNSIIATVVGYPKVRKLPKKSATSSIGYKISIEPLFCFSPDLMEVTLVIHPIIQGLKSLRNENLRKLIFDHKIVYGVQPEALKEAIDFCREESNEYKNILLAKGEPPGESIDAHLVFGLPIGPLAGTILEDGSIDFRERKIMVAVNEGQKIATKIEAVHGGPGKNVLGDETPTRPGKDITVKVKNDAVFNRVTGEITAKKDGVLSVVNRREVNVCSHQNIPGDIDFHTGNVESMNSITIQGSVQPGFKVNVNGDLSISGGVMSAEIHCGGNLVIKGGITGKKSSITSLGDCDINFVEQGTLLSEGLIVVRNQSYYSSITAKADIRCHHTSKIMGGKLIAEGNITLGKVGSENSKPATISAGVVAKRLEKYQLLKTSIVKQQEDIIQWIQRYPGSSNSKKVKTMEQELSDMKLSLLRMNMIPGTGLYSRVAGPNEDELSGDEYSDEHGIDISETSIDVYGTIHASTEIRIGNRTMVLDKTVANRQFRLHPNGKRILAGPIKKKAKMTT